MDKSVQKIKRFWKYNKVTLLVTISYIGLLYLCKAFG